ncbi:flagellar biosynthesis anti-sigma factor FlgM [Vibrio sp. AK197]|uniref:Negative regulator of flagellin synthesis n=1 Tax=Vibrio olivae TaxID=1243002 RepID=A0ABV5HKI2_9VIBR
MKIDKVSGGHVPQTSFNQSRSNVQSTPEAKSAPQSAMNVNTAAIDRAQAAMASLPDVDMAKVEKVKDALVKGELKLDTKALSHAIMQFHTGHES